MAVVRKAAATAKTRKATKITTKSKAAPVAEVEDDELEELEEDEVEEAPKAKKADDVVFGVADICALINRSVAKGAKQVTPRELRTLIRKMAREENARVDRVITPGNRTRYSWAGPNDPEVKAIIAAFAGGELEADKQEKLQALKDKKAAQKAEAAAPAKPTARKRKVAATAVEEDEDVEELELDDDED